MSAWGQTFRVFVSSTFDDFELERGALADNVFPRLRRLCEQLGTRFQAIDLRWGISGDAAADQQTMPICLRELDRCMETTRRPCFILLVGDRYGWIPLPSQIPADEFEAMLGALDESDRRLLAYREAGNESQGWYRRDDNAAPSVYELRPRNGAGSAAAVSGDGAAGGDDAERAWRSVEVRVRRAFRVAMDRMGWPTDDRRRVPYECSATHQELLRALERGHPDGHAFAFVREVTNAADVELPAAYHDAHDQGEPEGWRAARLDALKANLDRSLRGRWFRYSTTWLGSEIDTGHIQQLVADAYDALARVIREEVAKAGEVDPLDTEIGRHREFGAGLVETFVGRERETRRIAEYLSTPAPGPLVVIGLPGVGKSTLIARAVSAWAECADSREWIVRFVGTTAEASSAMGTLEGIFHQWARFSGTGSAPVGHDMTEWASAVARLADATPADKRVVMVLDGIDRWSDADAAQACSWLPTVFPGNLHLVISVASDADVYAAMLRSRYPTATLLEVPPLPQHEAEELLSRWLEKAGRMLSPVQRAEVLNGFAACPLALYLRLAFDQAKHWRSYWSPERTRLPTSIEGLVERFMDRVCAASEHGAILPQRAFGYLLAGRYGLAEDELLDVLSLDREVMSDLRQRSRRSPRTDRVPLAIWCRLFADIEDFLMPRTADGVSVFGFYHHALVDVLRRRCSPPEVEHTFHGGLADYFAGLRARGAGPGARLRVLSELPYQQIHAGRFADLDATLVDLEFMEAKCAEFPPVGGANASRRFGGIHRLIDDYREALDALSSAAGPPPGLVSRLGLLRRTLVSETAVLTERPKLLVQQVHNAVSKKMEFYPDLARAIDEGIEHQCRIGRAWFRLAPGSNIAASRAVELLVREARCAHLCLRPHARQFAAGGREHVTLWDWDAREEMFRIGGNGATLVGLGWLNARQLGCVWRDGRVSVLDMESRQIAHEFRTGQHPLEGATFSGDGRTLLVWQGVDTTSARIIALDPETGEGFGSWEISGGQVRSAALSSDGAFAVVAGERFDRSLGERAMLYRLDLLGAQLVSLQDWIRGYAIVATHLVRNETAVACGGLDGSVHVIEVATGMIVAQLGGRRGSTLQAMRAPRPAGHEEPVHCLVALADQRRLVSGSGLFTTGELRIWDLESELLRGVKRAPTNVRVLAMAPDPDRVIVGGDSLYSMSIRSQGVDDELGSKMATACFSPDGHRIVCARRGDLFIDSPRDGASPLSVAAHAGHVTSVAWHPEGHCIASAGTDHRCVLWDATSGACLKAFEWGGIEIGAVGFAPDGTLAVAGDGGRCMLVREDDAETYVLETGRDEALAAVAFSPDADWLAAAGSSGVATIWDKSSGRAVASLEGHVGNILDLEVLFCGSIVTAGSDQTIRWWRWERGSQARLELTVDTLRDVLLGHSRLPGVIASNVFDGTCRYLSRDGGAEGAFLSERIWPTAMTVLAGEDRLVLLDDEGRRCAFVLSALVPQLRLGRVLT